MNESPPIDNRTDTSHSEPISTDVHRAAALWSQLTSERYFLIPEYAPLARGPLELQSLAGRKRQVNLAQVKRYEISSEEAAHHIKARIKSTAERAVGGVLDVLAAGFRKRGADAGSSDTPPDDAFGAAPETRSPKGAGLEVLADLARLPVERLREDPGALWDAARIVGRLFRDLYVGATRGDDAALAEARRKATAIQQTLSEQGVHLSREGGNLADQLRAAQPVLAEARAETAARFEHAAEKIHGFLRGAETLLRDAAEDVRPKDERPASESKGTPDNQQGS